MKRLPFVVLFGLAGLFVAFRSIGNIAGMNTPPGKYEKVMKLVADMMNYAHFNPQKIDDSFSEKVFKKFIEEVDSEKNIFLSTDIASLNQKFGKRIDNELGGEKVESFLAIGNTFTERMAEVEKFYKTIIEQPFDFTKDEEVVLNYNKVDFPAKDADRKERWRKKLKFMVLERYVELQEIRAKNKGKKDFVVKTDKELEVEAREKVKKVIGRLFERYHVKYTDDDKFNQFVNSITTTMDPHTEFMPPIDKRYFDEQMSGEFFGIGALLQYDEGNIKIASVLTGSPAAKSGEIQAGDIIQKVGQATEEPVELVGYFVQDALKLIRGKNGTEVRLTIKKIDGSIKTVSLIREKIVQDETFARSAVVQNGDSKIGYIYLPEFYANFDQEGGARSYIDVAKEVEKLKAENVDGIVMDLRNNGGGSLYDVVQMVGLFIDQGPVVQVKDRQNKANVLKDKNSEVLYNGPLAVLVNEFSASASEIFAAAIQDYGRGVVIGSSTTYGKGTVQRNIGIDPSNGFSSNSDLGTIKLTLQKFYRVSGASTQLKGVTPDVIIPDQYEYLKLREKDGEDALGWDEIAGSEFTKWKNEYDLNTVKQSANDRVKNTPRFMAIKKVTEWLASQEDKTYSLNIEKYKAYQKKVKQTLDELSKLTKLESEMNVAAVSGEEKRWVNDENKQTRFEQWLKALKSDVYLDQAVKVLQDAVMQENIAKAKTPVQKEEVKKAF